MPVNFNPHPLWRGRPVHLPFITSGFLISIHTLCEEGDSRRWKSEKWFVYFNPHPLWRGRPSGFLEYVCNILYFNPHPLWRGRLSTILNIIHRLQISIHTLCEEGDNIILNLKQQEQISIHTLCEEGDCFRVWFFHLWHYFNPHPLWRGRHDGVSKVSYINCYFNPHPLWRGRRFLRWLCVLNPLFQSTPSVKRATLAFNSKMAMHIKFQSTPSVKRATVVGVLSGASISISIHTLCEEGDMFQLIIFLMPRNFNPHPLWRGRHSHT